MLAEHPTHFDIRALVTVVISLQSTGVDFEGGLYVSTGHGTEMIVALQSGDAVAHQSNLLHGVRVTKGERWSWITWYKGVGDPRKCDSDTGVSWNAAAAEKGDPVAQVSGTFQFECGRLGTRLVPLIRRCDTCVDDIHAVFTRTACGIHSRDSQMAAP